MRKPTGTWTHLQYISAFLQPFLPNIPGEYDLAAQYLGVADTLVHKVNAKYKVAWNHTDYATQHPNQKLDRRVYTNVDYVVSVSESCTEAFRRMYPAFSQKAVTVENCLARELIERKSLLPAAGLVGSEMCIRDRCCFPSVGFVKRKTLKPFRKSAQCF